MSNLDIIRGRQVVVPLTNKSGGTVNAGDVVIIDTANDAAFTTTTTARSETTIGIAQETIANNASGRVLTAGYAALVNVPASVTRGHYIETHTVAKQATGSATRRSGSFGQFLTGGTTPTAILGGLPDQTATAGSSGYAEGTSFPGSPATNDKFYRTDRNILYEYNGTRWLSVQLYRQEINVTNGSVTVTTVMGRMSIWHTTYDLWLETFDLFTYVATTNDGSKFWTINLLKYQSNFSTSSTLATRSTGTVPDTANTVTTATVSIGALLDPTTYKEIQVEANKTSTPGALSYGGALVYRLVG